MPYCDGCGEYESDYDDMTEQSCGNYVCMDCENSDGCDCDGCQDGMRRRGAATVHSYGWTPRAYNSKGNYPTEPLLGVELEVGRRESVVAEQVYLIDSREYHLYLKTDSSIKGVEIVTHPATLSWMQRWNTAKGNNFDLLLAGLRDSGCDVSSFYDGYRDREVEYGLHVHVSRNAFKTAPRRPRDIQHQYRWLLFIYRNARALTRLGGRNPERWGTFEDVTSGELKRKASSDPYYAERYVAVNTNPAKTYELRWMAATLDQMEFWARVEFASASVDYTRDMTSNDALHHGALRWSTFMEWAGKQGKYPNLTDIGQHYV